MEDENKALATYALSKGALDGLSFRKERWSAGFELFIELFLELYCLALPMVLEGLSRKLNKFNWLDPASGGIPDAGLEASIELVRDTDRLLLVLLMFVCEPVRWLGMSKVCRRFECESF